MDGLHLSFANSYGTPGFEGGRRLEESSMANFSQNRKLLKAPHCSSCFPSREHTNGQAQSKMHRTVLAILKLKCNHKEPKLHKCSDKFIALGSISSQIFPEDSTVMS